MSRIVSWFSRGTASAVATAMIGKGQDELRQHFQQSAEVLAKAAKELSA